MGAVAPRQKEKSGFYPRSDRKCIVDRRIYCV